MALIISIPSESDLEEMIILEESARRSEEYIQSCTNVASVPNGWLTVTANLQEQIIKSKGFGQNPLSMQIALNKLRRARYYYPENPIFLTPLYVANNKANKGSNSVGDLIPDICLYDLNSNPINLHSIISNKTIKTIIFAGSHT